MITKKELVKIISKKAAIGDTSAKELFDLFLRKIAFELQPGESAQFSNVGYFHFRKGKVKKEAPDTGESRTEYLDLIIFSTSAQLDIKSAGNLVFSVPDASGGGEDNLDAHFSLSVGKPVLPNLEGSNSASYSTDELQEILNRKVENLMVNLHKDESVIADSEILLVDMKIINLDQYELELDEGGMMDKSPDADDTIHSSEQLKSIAWSFGKDLSNQIKDKSDTKDDIADLTESEKSSESEFKDRAWDEPTLANTIDLNGEFDIEEAPDESEKVIDHTGISSEDTLTDNNNQDAAELSEHALDEHLTKDNNKEIFELAAEDIDESIDADKLADRLIEDVDLTDLDIEMDDFEVSENDEIMGKFERVRSISSSFSDENSLKDIEGFDSFIEDKIDIGKSSISNKNEGDDTDIFEDKTEPVKSNELNEKEKYTSIKPVKKKELKLNRVDSKKSRQQYDRKSSSTKFLIILATFAIVIGVIYLITKSNTVLDQYEEVAFSRSGSENTTYIERTYDIPVNYPYDKSEDDLQVTGLRPPDEETTDNNPEGTNVSTQPPADDVSDTQEPPVIRTGQRPSGTPVQAAYNIYRYRNKYIVQVSAFNSHSMAQNEVMKYTSQGYNAFIERASIDGRLWYRVRVGNFNSLDEAKRFRASQQK